MTTKTSGDGKMMFQDEANVLGKRDLAKVKDGETVWRRMKNCAVFAEWLVIGEAIEVGRSFATKKTGSTKGGGRSTGYNAVFSGWLKAHHFDDIHKTTRTALHNIMTWKTEAVRWHKGLTAGDRADRLNHPVNVWKAFEKAFENEIATKKREAAAAKMLRDLIKDGMTEDDALAHVAALPASEEMVAKPPTLTEKLMAQLAASEADNVDLTRRAAKRAEELRELRGRLGMPELPDEPLVLGSVTEQELLHMLIRTAPREWSIDRWDTLHELLGRYIEEMREGGTNFLDRLTAEPGKAKPKRKRSGTVTDLNDDIPI